MSFADGLRAALRQDPNVLLVGEVRDTETAEIACRAALTGHLVLTTLHTKDAVGPILRLQDLGVDPAVLASALSLIISQRLVRRLCECARVVEPSPDALRALGLPLQGTYREAQGCSNCVNTGYRGRAAVMEALEVTPPVRALLAAKHSEDELRRTLKRMGNRSLQDAARDLASQGVTSIAEITRVLSFSSQVEVICPNCAAEVMESFRSCPRCLVPLQASIRPTGGANKILIADDDDALAQIVAVHVSSLGFEPIRACDGPTAIRMAREIQPAAIIMDVFMPRLTGIEACQRLREDPLTAQIPVIVMTADDGQELKIRAYDMGTDDFVQKPIDGPDLLERLERVLARRDKIEGMALAQGVAS